VRAWPVPCAWVKWVIAWSRPSSSSEPKDCNPFSWSHCWVASIRCKPHSPRLESCLESDAEGVPDKQVSAPLEAVPVTNATSVVAPLPKTLPAIQAPAMATPRAQGKPVSAGSLSIAGTRLVNQAGEVMITRSRMDERLTQLRTSLAELTGNLDRLRQQLRDVELQAESQMQIALGADQGFRSGI